MKQSFTPDHLIKYLYNEVTATERLGLEEALAQDYGLFEHYTELKAAYNQLPRVKFSPSPATLQNILGYSERSALEQQA
jgi:hypothetical protein